MLLIEPINAITSAEEIADWIYFIAVRNKSMTGQDIIIDNGEMINSKFVWTEDKQEM